MDGTIKLGQKIKFMKNGATHEVTEMGQFRPHMTKCNSLGPGQVGYILTGLKELGAIHVGDTVSDPANPAGLGSAGLSSAAANGVLRDVSHRCHRL